MYPEKKKKPKLTNGNDMRRHEMVDNNKQTSSN